MKRIKNEIPQIVYNKLSYAVKEFGRECVYFLGERNGRKYYSCEYYPEDLEIGTPPVVAVKDDSVEVFYMYDAMEIKELFVQED